MADGLNFYLNEGEAREPGWEEINQKATTARSGGSTVDVGWNPVRATLAPGQSKNVHRERHIL